MINFIISTDDSKTTILIRLMVGLIFLSEGIQKFIFPSDRGAGRFESLGLPMPEFLGSFVASFEVTCGILIIIGFLTRLAACPTLIIMILAILTSKTNIFVSNGFWEMLHASRTDWSMLLGSIFLIINGGGYLSLDAKLMKEDSSNDLDTNPNRKISTPDK
ncbi:MAG: DoxX family protein [Candidatus Kapaibacterium sp.]|nr:DoxX family protein [Candidatus Kapabacteria bacterium]